MDSFSKSAKPTSDFQIAAQAACDAILGGDRDYRAQPEAWGKRTAILQQVQAMIADSKLDARRLELHYIPAGWTTHVRDALSAALAGSHRPA